MTAIIGAEPATREGDGPARVARLSYFFPAHNEEANLAGLVEEALETLPMLADEFEIIAVNDGSRDRTQAIADELTAAHPDIVRAVHHPTNLGYGAALRSGFRAARYELVAFTDGDRQFRVEDIGRLTARLAQPDAPDVVGTPENLIDVTVEQMEFLGSFWRCHVVSPRFGTKRLVADFSINAVRRLNIETGGAMQVELPQNRLLVFPKAA